LYEYLDSRHPAKYVRNYTYKIKKKKKKKEKEKSLEIDNTGRHPPPPQREVMEGGSASN
jgi:hypothetical protein